MADDISRHKSALRRKQGELRQLLREWDPIGVYQSPPIGPPDEYDCLLSIVGRLREGMSREHLEWYLSNQMTDHFGLSHAAAGTRTFAEKVYDWYWRDPLPGSVTSGA
jgi:hypothetical protein